MTEQERLAAALEYQQAQQPAMMNPNLAAQGVRARENASTFNSNLGVIPQTLSAVNRALPLPTNARVYVESVIDQRKDPITNKDFTNDELNVIRDLVQASHQPNEYKNEPLAATPGYVNYSTYKKPLPSLEGRQYPVTMHSGPAMATPRGRVGTTLGQFNYGLNSNGDIEVKDKYDFNEIPGINEYKDTSALNKVALTLKSGGYIPARVYGQEMLPAGSGRDVNVVIPKEKFGENYNQLAEALKKLGR